VKTHLLRPACERLGQVDVAALPLKPRHQQQRRWEVRVLVEPLAQQLPAHIQVA
jgi:hypothetical protein